MANTMNYAMTALTCPKWPKWTNLPIFELIVFFYNHNAYAGGEYDQSIVWWCDLDLAPIHIWIMLCIHVYMERQKVYFIFLWEPFETSEGDGFGEICDGRV